MGKRVDADYFMEELHDGHGRRRAATTCSPSTWTWTRCRVTPWRTGRAVTATSTDPRLRHAAAHPVARGHRARAERCGLARPLAGEAVAAPGAAGRRSSAPRRMGFEPMFGTELEFYLFKETFAEAHAKHYADLTPSVPYILDYHVLATTYDETVHQGGAQRHEGSRHQGGELEGRGVARPAGDQLPLLGCADDGRQPRHLQERDQGDGEPARLLGDVHGEAGPHVDRELVPRPLEPVEGRQEHVRGRVGDRSSATSRGHIACGREIAIFLAPNINSYKRYAAASGRRRRWPGAMTTGRADSASSATASPCAPSRASRAPT